MSFRDKIKSLNHWSFYLIIAGVAIEFCDEPLLFVGMVLCGAGLVFFAKNKVKSAWYGLAAIIPVFGPLLGICGILQVKKTVINNTSIENYDYITRSNYRAAIRDAVIMQIIILILAAVATDYGQMLQFWGFSMAAYWPMAIMLIVRSKKKTSRVDINIIRWGFLFLITFFTPVISMFVWYLRGIF